MSTETVGRLSLDEAFRQAEKTLPGGEDTTAETEASPATDTDDTEAGEQQTAEQTSKVGDQTVEATEEFGQLLTDEEVEALDEKQREVFKKGRKSLTEKFQSLSADRKAFEAERAELTQAAEFVKALREDPATHIRKLAEQVGLKIAETASEPEQQSDEIQLPEAYSFLKPVLAPFEQQIKALKEQNAKLQEQITPVMDSTRKAQADAVFAQMAQKHPGWEEHRAAMFEQSKSFPQGQGVDDLGYLESLYKLVTYDTARGDQLRKQAEAAKKSTAAADTGESGVAKDKVAPSPPKAKNFNDMFDKAFEAAKRGERWE